MILNEDVSIECIYNTIVEKLKIFFKNAGSSRAVLGLSGGIDSAVVMPLACAALGVENVHGILMPSQFSTDHSVKDAEDLAKNLGASYDIIPIKNIYESYLEAMSDYFADGKWSVAQENIQARVRGAILMTYSNKYNALVLNTSNKSELSMGYGTLYGDMCGALMVIADLYKLQVYELARYINREREIIPLSTLTKAPSAELHPGQKDTDSLPKYEVLDPILYMLNEDKLSAEEIVAKGYDAQIVTRVSNLKKRSSFKIHQIPPIIKLTENPIVYSEKCI